MDHSATLTHPESHLNSLIIEVLKTVFDPEIPVNIYELGLVYLIDVHEDGTVRLDMTLTAPNCPVAHSLPREVSAKVGAVPGVKKVDLNLVWDPPWDMNRMSRAARITLGMV